MWKPVLLSVIVIISNGMGYFLRYRLNIKIFVSFVFIITVTTFIALSIGYQLIKSSVIKANTIRLEDSITAYYNEIKFKEEECLKAVRTLSRDSEIIEMLESNNIRQLEKRLLNYYRMGIFDIIEIEKTDGSVLIRGHDPEKSGDIKIDQNIIQAGLAGKTGVSYESGISGIAIRAVAPVESGGEIISLLMVGTLFSKDLVENMRKLTGLENGIYKGSRKIISTYPGIETIGEERIKALLETGTIMFSEKIDGKTTYFMMKALYSEEQEFWGAINLFISQGTDNQYLGYMGRLLFLMIMVGFSLSLIAYLVLASNINDSLVRIINGINNFSISRDTPIINVKSNDEFRIIADSINNLSRKLYNYNRQIAKLQEDMIKSAKLAVVGQMSAGLAHEIRNPLSSIKMMSQILRSRYSDGREGAEEINTILEEIDRINSLVKDLLEFSKPGPMHFSKHDINILIQNTVKQHRYNIEHQNIKIEYSLDPHLPAVYIDGEKLKICFINFIINAIQAMPEGGVLSVSTEGKNNELVIEIRNNGKMIPEKDLKKIFDPFYTTKKDGTGLGLALSRLIIERHYGKIEVSSTEKETLFRVVLPLRGSIIPLV